MHIPTIAFSGTDTNSLNPTTQSTHESTSAHEPLSISQKALSTTGHFETADGTNRTITVEAAENKLERIKHGLYEMDNPCESATCLKKRRVEPSIVSKIDPESVCFQNVPAEIKQHILSYLSTKDAITFTRVSKHSKEAVYTLTEKLDFSKNFDISKQNLLGALNNWNNQSRIKSLDLSYCIYVDKDVLDFVAEHFKYLTQLSLVGCSQLKDSDLFSLYKLTHLTHLYVTSCYEIIMSCYQITDDGLAYISYINTLTHLDISLLDRITDNGLAHVSHLSNLTHLVMRDCDEITNNGLKYISNLSGLTHLDMSRCSHISDEGLAYILNLSNLTYLNLDHCGYISDEGLAYIGQLSNLTYLNLDSRKWSDISNEGLAYLTQLTQLTHFTLGSLDSITDVGLPHIASISNLTYLNLGYYKYLTDKGLICLTNLRHLTYLDLMCYPTMTDEGLAHIGYIPNLTHLILHNCKNLTDASLIHISKLTHLNHLVLNNFKHITDTGLAHISKLSSLMYLRLDHCEQITDSGLVYLSKLSHLTDLILNGSADLEIQLEIGGPLKGSGHRELRTRLPNLKVFFLKM